LRDDKGSKGVKITMMRHDQLHDFKSLPANVALWRSTGLAIIIAAIGLFVCNVALRGFTESWDNDGFPEDLAVKLELLPLVFPLHMVTGAAALVLVPSTMGLRVTRWHTWHKLAGRITAAVVLVAGFTAIPVALTVPVTPISAAGFTVQGLTWMVLLGLGIWHIRNGRTAQHRDCMLMMAAVTSGAVFFRVYLGTWKYFMGASQLYGFYAVDAWLAWSLPCLAMASWLVRGRSKISYSSKN
jgi:Predicted membrane protein (DUF2306)